MLYVTAICFETFQCGCWNIFRKILKKFFAHKKLKKSPQKVAYLKQKFRRFRNFPFTGQQPKWQNSCSQMWPIEQLYIELGCQPSQLVPPPLAELDMFTRSSMMTWHIDTRSLTFCLKDAESIQQHSVVRISFAWFYLFVGKYLTNFSSFSLCISIIDNRYLTIVYVMKILLKLKVESFFFDLSITSSKY